MTPTFDPQVENSVTAIGEDAWDLYSKGRSFQRHLEYSYGERAMKNQDGRGQSVFIVFGRPFNILGRLAAHLLS